MDDPRRRLALETQTVRDVEEAGGEEQFIMAEIISKEPLGPVVRHGDDQFFDIVKWTVFALIEAEEQRADNEQRMQALLDVGYKEYVGQEFIPTRDPLEGLTQAVTWCDV